MLVLSRKPHERILVGNDIVIEITRIQGGRVKLGVIAPDRVTVRRTECVPIPAASDETENKRCTGQDQQQAGL